MKKTEVFFNKPVYVGQAILDLSKTLMFDFHYNYIQRKYGHSHAKLLSTDTDSLMYEINTDDFYKDISKDISKKFDTSDYPPSHPSGILTGVNKKVIGMFKDEVAGRQITHFVGLRPKLYSFKVEDEKANKKCKGIKKNIVKKDISFEDYVQCLFSGEKQMRSMKIIKSENHDIYSKEVNKVEDEKANKKCKGIKKNIVKKDISFEDYVQCLFSGEKQMRSMKIIKSENHDIYSKEVNKVALSNEDDKRNLEKDKVNTLALR